MISEENFQRGLKLLKEMGRENTLFETEIGTTYTLGATFKF